MEKLSRPGKIVCVGRNYMEHVAEMGNEAPAEPVLFLKPPSAVIGAGDPIVLPGVSDRVEHEAEIGVVIGDRLRRVNSDEAMWGIRGIVCVNDVTARDFQKQDAQWTRAKGFDTFCPVGPHLVPLSDLPGIDELEVIGRVNGEVRQRGSAQQMTYRIPTLLSYISYIMTLEPGDLVATGTPAGVGPLTAGDVVEVEVPGVGTLSNPVVTEGNE